MLAPGRKRTISKIAPRAGGRVESRSIRMPGTFTWLLPTPNDNLGSGPHHYRKYPAYDGMIGDY
jgi:hypothetical protein